MVFSIKWPILYQGIIDYIQTVQFSFTRSRKLRNYNYRQNRLKPVLMEPDFFHSGGDNLFIDEFDIIKKRNPIDFKNLKRKIPLFMIYHIDSFNYVKQFKFFLELFSSSKSSTFFNNLIQRKKILNIKNDKSINNSANVPLDVLCNDIPLTLLDGEYKYMFENPGIREINHLHLEPILIRIRKIIATYAKNMDFKLVRIIKKYSFAYDLKHFAPSVINKFHKPNIRMNRNEYLLRSKLLMDQFMFVYDKALERHIQKEIQSFLNNVYGLRVILTGAMQDIIDSYNEQYYNDYNNINPDEFFDLLLGKPKLIAFNKYMDFGLNNLDGKDL